MDEEAYLAVKMIEGIDNNNALHFSLHFTCFIAHN